MYDLIPDIEEKVNTVDEVKPEIAVDESFEGSTEKFDEEEVIEL